MSSNITFKNSTGHAVADGKIIGGPAPSAQGQILVSNSNNDFVATPMQFSYKNKIINGGMTINQRDTTYDYSAFSTTYSGYNLDRWKCEYKVGASNFISESIVSDFSSGNDFATNGWTVVNANLLTQNAWVIGTSGGSGTSGNSAYISSNYTGTSKGYNTSNTTICHFYKDITIPSSSTGSLFLKFDGNIMGEGVWDCLNITIASTSFVPVTGTLPTGAIVFTSTSYASNTLFLGPFTSSSLDSYKGQTVRVIFSWKNDLSGGTPTGGASVDNIRIADIFVSTNVGYKSITPTSQITSISNFEAGNTFALNGFTEVNGAQVNKWYVGTFGGTGQSGTYSAVISNNGTSKGYTITSASIVHFYKDITVPSISATYPKTYLRFNANIAGEGTTTLYDYVAIRVDSTSTIPVAGTNLTTGYLVYRASSASGSVLVDLSPFSGQTVRLIFTWANDTSGGTATGGATIDNIEFYQATPSSKNMITQSASVYPNGLSNSMAYENLAYTPCIINQSIEAYNCQEFLFGTASAKDVSISFWVRSGVTGTYCVYLQNAAKTLTYVKEYVINAADTWERKTLTIPGCTTGTWTAGTVSAYMIFGFSLEDGSTGVASANTWNANGYTQTIKQTNFASNSNIGKFFYVTGVQLEVGSTCTPFEMRPYHTELALCQRYYQKNIAKTSSGAVFGTGVAASTSSAVVWYKFNTPFRAAPTFAYQTFYHTSLSDGGMLRQISAFSISATATNVSITATALNSNLTANRAQALVQTGTALAALEFIAEL